MDRKSLIELDEATAQLSEDVKALSEKLEEAKQFLRKEQDNEGKSSQTP